MQKLQSWNIVIQISEDKLAPILSNIVPFHYSFNGSVHNSK